MDRSGNSVKIERIRRAIEAGEYPKALELAKTVDTARIKSAADLSVVAEAYFKNSEYETALVYFEQIYQKKQSRRILISLINLCLKLSMADMAESYLKDFEEMAPQDFYCHIFRYRIDKLRGESLDVLIYDLELLKEDNYMEDWAYELAKLYHKNGQAKKCVAECDDIILWFGSGVYVERARGLRAINLSDRPVESLTDIDRALVKEVRSMVDSGKSPEEVENFIEESTTPEGKTGDYSEEEYRKERFGKPPVYEEEGKDVIWYTKEFGPITEEMIRQQNTMDMLQGMQVARQIKMQMGEGREMQVEGAENQDAYTRQFPLNGGYGDEPPVGEDFPADAFDEENVLDGEDALNGKDAFDRENAFNREDAFDRENAFNREDAFDREVAFNREDAFDKEVAFDEGRISIDSRTLAGGASTEGRPGERLPEENRAEKAMPKGGQSESRGTAKGAVRGTAKGAEKGTAKGSVKGTAKEAVKGTAPAETKIEKSGNSDRNAKVRVKNSESAKEEVAVKKGIWARHKEKKRQKIEEKKKKKEKELQEIMQSALGEEKLYNMLLEEEQAAELSRAVQSVTDEIIIADIEKEKQERNKETGWREEPSMEKAGNPGKSRIGGMAESQGKSRMTGMAEGQGKSRMEGMAKGQGKSRMEGMAKGQGKSRMEGMVESQKESRKSGTAEGQREASIGGMAEGQEESRMDGMAEGQRESSMGETAENQKKSHMETAEEQKESNTEEMEAELEEAVQSEETDLQEEVVSIFQYPDVTLPLTFDADWGRFYSLLEEKSKRPEDFFAPFMVSVGFRQKLLRCMEQLFEPDNKNITMIITGNSNSGKTLLAKAIAKCLQELGIMISPKVAIIRGRKLNRIRLAEKKDQLKDTTLIIEAASEMLPGKIVELLSMKEEFMGTTAVILEDERSKIDRILQENEELGKTYKIRADLPEWLPDDLFLQALAMLAAKDFRIEETVAVQFLENIRKQIEEHLDGALEAVYAYTEQVIRTTEKRMAQELKTMVLEGRYAEADLMLLKIEDL